MDGSRYYKCILLLRILISRNMIKHADLGHFQFKGKLTEPNMKVVARAGVMSLSNMVIRMGKCIV